MHLCHLGIKRKTGYVNGGVLFGRRRCLLLLRRTRRFRRFRLNAMNCNCISNAKQSGTEY